jgi:hypothetical protein
VKSLLRCLSVAALALGFAVAVSAEEKKAEDKKAVPFANVFTFPKTITVDADQQKKLDALKTEYTPKLEELKKKMDTILTADRVKAQKEAIDKAKADGKKGKELSEAGQAALKLSEAETKDLAELKTAQGKLMGEINKKKTELLTDEQKKALQPKPKDK